MAANLRTIEVDEETAEALESRAAEKVMSVSMLVAELADIATTPAAVSPDEVAELDRRWAATKDGNIVANADVVGWLRTWGTPSFKPLQRSSGVPWSS